MSPLLRLPRELRDLIYDFYVRCDGGYVYNTETQKFRRPDGGPISYTLALTCRQAASELEGLAFQVNQIIFSSTPIDSFREQAALQDAISWVFFNNGEALINCTARRLFTQEMRERVAEAYPKFAPYVEDWLKKRGHHWKEDCLGEAESVWCDFQRLVANLVSKHPAIDKMMIGLPPNYGLLPKQMKRARRDDIRLEPWRIYGKTELEHLSTMLRITPRNLDNHHPEARFAYSAASRALQFLDACTGKVRSYIRRIVLVENEVLGWNSECHGRGFIPFCQENKYLHVERRVDLWRTVLKPEGIEMDRYAFDWKSDLQVSDQKDDRLQAEDITRCAGRWMTEALALPSLGMPEGSYTLLFDGNPVPELSSKVFRIIQRDAAWQAALDACYSRGLIRNVSWLDRRRNRCYKFEGLPEVMQMLLAGNTLIQCNFELGASYDIEEIIERHRGYDWEAWHDAWSSHEPRTFQTEPPLPPWNEWCWGRYFHW